MTYDFRANQVRLNRIISSGSIPIIIYASSSATNLQGGTTFSTSSIGSDVFLYVSGSTAAAKTVFGGSVVVSGSLSASQLTGSLQNVAPNIPYLVPGSNITIITSSIGQITIAATVPASTGSAGEVSASYVLLSATGSLPNERVLVAGNDIRLTDSGPGSTVSVATAIWTEQTPSTATTTASLGIKTSNVPANVDVFINGTDTTGNGSNLVLYNDLTGFGLPRLTLSSSSGSLGSLVGYDNDVGGLVDGINIDIPASRNFGFRVGGGTTATTVDSSGNLNVRYGSNSTAYFDTANQILGLGNTPSNFASTYTSATRLVIKDSDSSGTKYQVFLSNEYPGSNLKSGIAFAFGPSSIYGSLYAKSDTSGFERKGLNVYVPTGNSFSWLSNASHLAELTDTANLTVSGSVKAYTGFSGSLRYLSDGATPYLTGSSGIIINYNSLGQYEITSSATGSSSVISSLLVVNGDGTNRGSGSVALTPLMTAGTIGKFDVEVLAIDFNTTTGASWKYTATALWPSAGSFTFLSATELSVDYGSPAGGYNPETDWDVNFNNLGQIELTGSAPVNGTSFYVQITKKMVSGFNSIIA